MSDYFLSNYQTSLFEKLSFPVLPAYSARHREEVWKAKTWLGWSVHLLIAGAESILFLGPLLALVERCLAWHYQIQPIKIERNIHQNVDDNIVNEPLPKIVDEALQKGDESKQKDAIEQKESKTLDKDLVFKDDPEIMDVEENQISDQAKTPSSPIDLKPTSGLDETIKQKASLPLNPDTVSTQEQATYHILATPGFIADPEDRPSRKGLKGEVQGNQALRHTVAKVTKLFPQAIGLKALKEQREVNLEQYLTIKLKRFAHAFALKGFVTLPSGKQFNLEGFCEAFTIPMLTASFQNYSKQGKFFSKADYEWVIEHFNQTTSSDHTVPDDIQVLACMLQDPNFVGPLALGTGHHWHSTATIFWGNYLIYCNRGSGDPPGIHIYYLPDRSRLTEAVIWEMTKRQEVGGGEFFGTKRIVNDLGGVLVHYEQLSSQGAGNCTLISMETNLHAFMVIRQIMNFFGENGIPQGDMDSSLWGQLFDNLRSEYDAWWSFDRQSTFQDMIEEIEEWMNKKSSFSQQPLIQTYRELLNAWSQLYADREPLPGQALSSSVKLLHEKFNS